MKINWGNKKSDFIELLPLAIAKLKDSTVKIAGISGYFPIDAQCERFFLKWHGVADAFKKQGLSQMMVETACQRIRAIHPEAKCLVEHMPAIAAFDAMAQSFSKMGFSPLDELHLHEWSPHPWREWEKTLLPAPKIKTKPF